MNNQKGVVMRGRKPIFNHAKWLEEAKKDPNTWKVIRRGYNFNKEQNPSYVARLFKIYAEKRNVEMQMEINGPEIWFGISPEVGVGC